MENGGALAPLSIPSSSNVRLRIATGLLSALQIPISCAIPTLLYIIVFNGSQDSLGPVMWTHWAISGFLGALGIIASTLLWHWPLSVLVVGGGVLSAALAGWETAFWLIVRLECIATEPALPEDTCSVLAVSSVSMCLAFMGLTGLLSMLPSLVLASRLLSNRRADVQRVVARRDAVVFAVATQSAIVLAGDKPSVTPQVLMDWVSHLLASDDPPAVSTALVCKSALARRGFDLVATTPSMRPLSRELP